MIITFLDRSTVGDVNLDHIISLGEYHEFATTSPNEVYERVANSDIIITNKVEINKGVMLSAPNLKLICIAATGINNVDLDFAQSRNIQVKNVSGYSTESVAQHTFALMLNLYRNIHPYDTYVKSGNYAQSAIFTNLSHSIISLSEKTIGIIGLGTIGLRVAELAQAFKMNVQYFSASGKNNNPNYKRVDLNTLLKTSDVISIHAPLNPYTEKLITHQQLKQMKKDAILINVGRGKIVDEDALSEALQKSVIAGAAIDVFENEPLSHNSPLTNKLIRDKIILTPHIAWADNVSRKTLIDAIYNNIKSFIEEIKNL